MALDLSALFGAAPDYSNVFSPEQQKTMQSQASQQALLGSLVALLGATGPQARPVSTGQALAGALGAGLGGYQSSFDNTLKQLLTAQQLGEYKQKQEARKRYEQAIAAATTQRPQTIPMATGEGSQLRMLQEQTADFGKEGANITAGALMSNPNLPMVDVVDPAAANRAAMDFVRQRNPEKFLELTAKEGKETFAIMTPEQKRAYGLPADRSFQIGSSGKIDEISKGPISTTTILPAESERQKGYGKLGVEQNTAIFTSGQSAVKNIAKIDETLNLIQQGTPTTGIGADLINNINRTKLLFTDSKKNIKEVSDTELLNSLLGADVFPQIGALGIGAKGLDTPAEREFLRQVMTGTINMNKDTLLRLTNLRKKYEEKSLDQYNKAVDEGQLDDLFKFSGLPKRKLTAPKTITVDF
jgi:hypothetical protein